jgi:hypothetical protein
MANRKSLLPLNTTQQQQNTRDHPEPLPNRRGAALQLDEFNLFVGRTLVVLGVLGNVIEFGTSTKAIMIKFLQNPGTEDPGFWAKLGLALFIAAFFQSALWTLVVNLNDSWINIFEGHPEKAFVTKGEVSLHTVMLGVFEFGGAGINAWWDIIFFGSITTAPFIISIGTAALVLSSILLWPLGWKISRHAKRRMMAAKRMAQQMAQQLAAEQLRNAVNVTPIVDSRPGSTTLIRYRDQ